MADQSNNLWAKSANPQTRKKAYESAQKRAATREMRTKNVQRESAVDKLKKKLF